MTYGLTRRAGLVWVNGRLDAQSVNQISRNGLSSRRATSGVVATACGNERASVAGSLNGTFL